MEENKTIGSHFSSWNTPDELVQAFDKVGESYETINQTNTYRASASNSLYQDILPGISVSDEFSRLDYEFFRPGESLPKTQREAIRMCSEIYDTNEIAHSVIDLMSDFAYQGIKIVHQSRAIQEQCNLWWKKIDAEEVSERFCNYLLRFGNVILTRETAILNSNEAKTELKTMAEETPEIPWKYWIFDPIEVEPISPDVARYSSTRLYGLRITPGIQKTMRKRKLTAQEEVLLNGVPGFIKNAKIQPNTNLLILPPEKTRAFHYKRTQKFIWGDPITRPMIQSFSVLKKAKLADLRALDGATSKITHWKIGSLEYKLIPNNNVLSSFENVILNASNNGAAINIVSGPEIDFKESTSDISKFLGETKYIPILASIYAGFGIPPVLIGAGTGGSGGGMSNNFVSIKSLLRRIQYVRKMLIKFWEEELRLFQLSMNHKRRAQLYFEHMNLTDEDAEKALLVQLVDRKIISAESVREAFGRNDNVETIRLNRQKSVPEQDQPVSAFSDAQRELALTKILAQRGEFTPSELNLTVYPRKPGEVSMKDMQIQSLQQKNTNKTGAPKRKNKVGVPGEGRPKNSQDSQKRKQRIPKASENDFLTSENIYNYIVNAYSIFKNDNINQNDISVINNIYSFIIDKINNKNLTFEEALDDYISSRNL